MIIEIKGMPEGQKIKRISVDIDFDENGAISDVQEKQEVYTKNSTEEKNCINEEMSDFMKGIDLDAAVPEDVKPEAVVPDETREKKPVPKEMLELEL